MISYVTQYTVIRVDAEDSQSDPDVFISTFNSMPTSEVESDQQCVRAGSEICILRKNLTKVDDTIYFSIQCLKSCQYSIKILTAPLKQIYDGQRVPLKLEARQVTILVYQVPANLSQSAIVDRFNLTVDTFSDQAPIQLYFSPTDDFTQIEERDVDLIVTNSGKTLRISSNDIGWCTNCYIYFIMKTQLPMLYTAMVKAASQQMILNDTYALNSKFDAMRNECISYNVEKSINDIQFMIRTYSSDIDFAIIARNLTDNQTTNTAILSSDFYYQKHYIVRSQDRQQFYQSNGIIYICAFPRQDSSATFQSNQFFSYNKFDLYDDTLTTFQLDSQDFLYFRFSNYMLVTGQTLTITYQSFNRGFSIPILSYKVCQFASATDCTLKEQQVVNYDTLTILNGVTNATAQSRTAVINHNPTMCQYRLSCHYLLAVYNPELSGPFSINLKLKMTPLKTQTIQLFGTYQGLVGLQTYQYFQVTFTPQQLAIYNITSLVFQLTSYIGRGELYVSTLTTQPTIDNCEGQARTLFAINELIFNVTKKDLSSLNVYVGVYGVTETQYQIKVDAIYTSNYPQRIPNSPYIDPLPQEVKKPDFSIVGATLISDRKTTFFTINRNNTLKQSTGTSTTTIANTTNFYFNASSNKAIIIRTAIIDDSVSSSYTFDVISSQNRSWLNNSGDLIIDPQPKQTTLLIRFRGIDLQQAINLNMTIYQVNQPPSSDIISDIYINKTYEGYVNQSTVLFRKLIMDNNGTYQYTLTYLIGNPVLMLKSGNYQGSIDVDDDSTYEYAAGAVDGEPITIKLDVAMRLKSNILCKNATYQIKGGNSNCTTYIGVQCKDFCIFNLSASLIVGQNKSFVEPQLFSGSLTLNGSIGRNLTSYFFIPYTRPQMSQLVDSAILLSKVNNDSYIVGKVINNAYLPYNNWTYPNRTIFDFRVMNNRSSYEILELTSNITNRCLVNASCVLIVGVVGNSQTNISMSTFTLKFFNSSNKLEQTQSARVSTIANPGDNYDYYWLIVNTTNSSNAFIKWSYLITAGTKSTLGDDLNLYANVISGQMPSSQKYDYNGITKSADVITITSDDSIFSGIILGPQMLIIIGVQVVYPDTQYTLVNFGPNITDTSVFGITNLMLGITDRAILASQQNKTNAYKTYKFFNFGLRDIQFNISCIDGSVYILASNYLYRQNEPSQQNKSQLVNLPLFNQTSLIQPPIYVNKNQSYLLQIGKDSNDNGLWCTLCAYYVTVFQNANNRTFQSIVNVTVTELQNAGSYIDYINPGQSVSTDIILENTPIQLKFVLDTRQLFEFRIQNSNNMSLVAYVGQDTDYLNNEVIWQASGNSTLVLRVKQSDSSFQIGVQYYLTVVAIEAPQNILISFKQVSLTRELTHKVINLDKMWTINDYVRFYYFRTPLLTNFTSQIIVKSLTPGMIPSIYLYRNDFVNTTYDFSKVLYPNLGRFTHKFEAPIFQFPNMTNTALFNVTAQNQTFNVSEKYFINVTMVNKTTGKSYNQTNTTSRNISYTVFNQTVYTMALYWKTDGINELQKADYELQYNMLPYGSRSLKESSSEEESDPRLLFSDGSEIQSNGDQIKEWDPWSKDLWQ